jgi:hypothetical protein
VGQAAEVVLLKDHGWSGVAARRRRAAWDICLIFSRNLDQGQGGRSDRVDRSPAAGPRRALSGVAVGVACAGCPPIPDLPQRYT